METVNQKCRYPGCLGMEMRLRVRDSGPHYADLICNTCGKHNGFKSKPDADRSKRPKAHTDLVAKFGRGFCELCLRPKCELRKCDVLEAQHVEEYQGGGDSSRENIWIVCTACHKLIHWMRTYHGHNKITPDSEGSDAGGPVGSLEDNPPWE